MLTSTNTDVPLVDQHDYEDDSFWVDLYTLLLALVRTWVRNAKKVSIWRRQEQEVVEDIVQTAMEKIFKSLIDARQRNKVIYSIEYWSIKVAKHCFLDLLRRESRLSHFSDDNSEPGERHLPLLDFLVDPLQEVEEKVYEEELLALSARTITAFSTKLRIAILVDLANHSYFDMEPTALQQAFMAAGICLQDYQRAPSADRAERGRQSALRSLAYKRLSQAHIV